MKSILVVLLSAVAVCPAAIVKFDLSPAGTDNAVGLSPLNETPPVTNSVGSGGPIAGGIEFDTTTSVLTFTIGYGSSAGFSDLTGPATLMHIHGPAPTNTPAGVLIDLMPFHFPATNPATGGVIVGSVEYPTNLVESLLGGSNYVNIHTESNSTGEIRGQLIPLMVPNAPPMLSCPAPSTNECATPSMVTAMVSDPEGDALTVVWSLNGVNVQTNQLAASTPDALAMVSFSAVLPLGANNVGISVSDTATNSTSCSTTVTVVDTTPPEIVSASADKTTLWPPNHKFVPVTVSAVVTDTCSVTTWKIISISSSQSPNAKGSGRTSHDWQITGDHTVNLRAERTGKGSADRIYTITLQAKDTSGNLSATKSVTVNVPHDQGNSSNNGNPATPPGKANAKPATPPGKAKK